MKRIMLLAICLSCLIGSSVFASPPGMMDKHPRGLEKHDKVPHGWMMGKKMGWREKMHHRHHHMDKHFEMKKHKHHI